MTCFVYEMRKKLPFRKFNFSNKCLCNLHYWMIFLWCVCVAQFRLRAYELIIKRTYFRRNFTKISYVVCCYEALCLYVCFLVCGWGCFEVSFLKEQNTLPGMSLRTSIVYDRHFTRKQNFIYKLHTSTSLVSRYTPWGSLTFFMFLNDSNRTYGKA